MATKNALQRYEPSGTGINLPENLDWKEWRILFDGYTHMAKTIPWVIGDLLVYGEEHYGEDVGQALDGLMARTRYTQGTIYNLVYVSKNVPPSVRNPNLSHGFHYEVAKMDRGDQAEWLATAEMEGWTVKEFRLAIKGKDPHGETAEPEPEIQEPESTSKPKQRTDGRINDDFDLWWDRYSRGTSYGARERQVALDAWNESIT